MNKIRIGFDLISYEAKSFQLGVRRSRHDGCENNKLLSMKAPATPLAQIVKSFDSENCGLIYWSCSLAACVYLLDY